MNKKIARFSDKEAGIILSVVGIIIMLISTVSFASSEIRVILAGNYTDGGGGIGMMIIGGMTMGFGMWCIISFKKNNPDFE